MFCELCGRVMRTCVSLQGAPAGNFTTRRPRWPFRLLLGTTRASSVTVSVTPLTVKDDAAAEGLLSADKFPAAGGALPEEFPAKATRDPSGEFAPASGTG